MLNGGTSSTAQAGVVYYASIAHGNQSVNKAGDIGAHIYDPQANTGIGGGTGFLRTLDSHEIFGVPLNIHPSGTLTIACDWARTAGGASDPQDGPSFLARVRDFVDADQASRPGSLIGGVLAEHIMPYFEGPVNAASLALTDSLNQVVYGVSAAQAKVMHVPERVIRSQDTGLSPLDGRTVRGHRRQPLRRHLSRRGHPPALVVLPRRELHAGPGLPAQGAPRQRRLLLHDQRPRGPGQVRQPRRRHAARHALQPAAEGALRELERDRRGVRRLGGAGRQVVRPGAGRERAEQQPEPVPQHHPLARQPPLGAHLEPEGPAGAGRGRPVAFVVDHGMRYDLSVQTYEWLKHASEDSYHYWYYDSNAGYPGNEQSFYDLVPVITGEQGDYHARGETPAQDGPPLPSGMKHGDLNTPRHAHVRGLAGAAGAPAGRLRDLGVASYLAMIYETAWHEEDAGRLLRLELLRRLAVPGRHLGRREHLGAAAAEPRAWRRPVRRRGAVGGQRAHRPARRRHRHAAVDLDWDGEAEYVIRNATGFAVFERYGARCVLACACDATGATGRGHRRRADHEPLAPGEEEYTGASANRCSAFKEMNGGLYSDAVYTAVAVTNGWRFTSPDGLVRKTMTMSPYSRTLEAAYVETVSGPLYVRLGLSPNPLDLMLHGQSHLAGWFPSANEYKLTNTSGRGAAVVEWPAGVTFNPAPSWSGSDRRNLALTEEVELSGDGSFELELRLLADTTGVAVGATPPPVPGAFALGGPAPSPARGAAHLELTLPERQRVRVAVVDLQGRRLATQDLGMREAGLVRVELAPRGDDSAALGPGLYFVKVDAGSHSATRRWVIVR